jgi:hypothetical protein
MRFVKSSLRLLRQKCCCRLFEVLTTSTKISFILRSEWYRSRWAHRRFFSCFNLGDERRNKERLIVEERPENEWTVVERATDSGRSDCSRTSRWWTEREERPLYIRQNNQQKKLKKVDIWSHRNSLLTIAKSCVKTRGPVRSAPWSAARTAKRASEPSGTRRRRLWIKACLITPS